MTETVSTVYFISGMFVERTIVFSPLHFHVLPVISMLNTHLMYFLCSTKFLLCSIKFSQYFRGPDYSTVPNVEEKQAVEIKQVVGRLRSWYTIVGGRLDQRSINRRCSGRIVFGH